MICQCGCGKEIEPERIGKRGSGTIKYRLECSERRHKEQVEIRNRKRYIQVEDEGTTEQERYRKMILDHLKDSSRWDKTQTEDK
jgi:hypothetical protein